MSYVGVAGVAFVTTVAARELFAFLLPADTAAYYLISIMMAYTLGIAINFTLQHSLTFRLAPAEKDPSMFAGFLVVALIGAGATAAVAALLRYGAGFEQLFGAWGGSAAFIVGNALASVLTYWLNARWVFGMAKQRKLGDLPEARKP
jgi:putative flippase GtrA